MATKRKWCSVTIWLIIKLVLVCQWFYKLHFEKKRKSFLFHFFVEYLTFFHLSTQKTSPFSVGFFFFVLEKTRVSCYIRLWENNSIRLPSCAKSYIVTFVYQGFSSSFTVIHPPQKPASPNSNLTRIEDLHQNRPRLMWLPV